MAANYKTITFRLDMNNPLDHRLYDTLAIQQTTSARNKLIKDVLIRSLLDGAGAVAHGKDTGADSEIKTMLKMLSGRISALEQSAVYDSPQRNRQNTEDSMQNMGKGRTLQSQFMQEPAEQEADVQSVDPEQQPVQTLDPVVSQEALDFLANLAKGGFS